MKWYCIARQLDGATPQPLQTMDVEGLLAMHGIHVNGMWWQCKTWSRIRSDAPDWVIELLEVFSRLIAPLEASAGSRQ